MLLYVTHSRAGVSTQNFQKLGNDYCDKAHHLDVSVVRFSHSEANNSCVEYIKHTSAVMSLRLIITPCQQLKLIKYGSEPLNQK